MDTNTATIETSSSSSKVSDSLED